MDESFPPSIHFQICYSAKYVLGACLFMTLAFKALAREICKLYVGDGPSKSKELR